MWTRRESLGGQITDRSDQVCPLLSCFQCLWDNGRFSYLSARIHSKLAWFYFALFA